MVEPGEIRVKCMAINSVNSGILQSGPIAIGEPRWVRATLITVALLFLGIFLLCR